MDFYMDNFISEANTKKEALEIGRQVTSLLKEGGFKLHKWASNSKDLLNDMQKSPAKNQLLDN